MNIKVVTSIVGNGRDTLKDSLIKDPNAEYIAYTDLSSKEWKIKSPCSIFSEDKKNAKIHKILIHQFEQCDYSIWIDGNVGLMKSPTEIIYNLLGDNDIAIARHGTRTNLFEEGEYIKIAGVEYPEIIDNQLDKYRDQEYEIRKERTLCFATMIIRKHNDKVAKFNNDWWSEICCNSFRDQVSLPYILRQHDLKANIFDNRLLYEHFYRTQHMPITYK